MDAVLSWPIFIVSPGALGMLYWRFKAKAMGVAEAIQSAIDHDPEMEVDLDPGWTYREGFTVSILEGTFQGDPVYF